MSIQPISDAQSSFKSKKVSKTNLNNAYYQTSAATKTGFLAGIGASALLFYTQVKSLATVAGKRSLISSFHEKGMHLSDLMPKSAERSKKIVNGFKKNLILWGLGITAATTILGKIVDVNVNLTKEKRADEEFLHIK